MLGEEIQVGRVSLARLMFGTRLWRDNVIPHQH